MINPWPRSRLSRVSSPSTARTELHTCTKIMQHLRAVALSPEASRELISNLLKGR